MSIEPIITAGALRSTPWAISQLMRFMKVCMHCTGILPSSMACSRSIISVTERYRAAGSFSVPLAINHPYSAGTGPWCGDFAPRASGTGRDCTAASVSAMPCWSAR